MRVLLILNRAQHRWQQNGIDSHCCHWKAGIEISNWNITFVFALNYHQVFPHIFSYSAIRSTHLSSCFVTFSGEMCMNVNYKYDIDNRSNDPTQIWLGKTQSYWVFLQEKLSCMADEPTLIWVMTHEKYPSGDSCPTYRCLCWKVSSSFLNYKTVYCFDNLSLVKN